MANSRLCSISDCGKPHSVKGYCFMHYKRFRTHGDPLGGRTPNGEPLRFVHEVALHHTGDDCLTWPFGKLRNGYCMVRVDGKMVYTHRYVCELVHGAPPTPEHHAAHSCGKGDEGCIAPEHLDWKTCAENQADRLGHGTSNRGERHGQAKITEAEAREILSMKGIQTPREIAERLDVSPQTICDIHAGRRWAWLSEGAKA
ncbi:hypothetical protein ELG76_04245 [Rhizobium leguminosarum]|uniref:hypothetical protein n=1 Tax=Rhizobium leguminosarum TaxID=384 RepID=UPI001030981D|nr:hypothetical protein [Rhizobium leguminosarum]TBG78631.1 hypothetical protein ELG76_04245 [Rhizobium leguminosarum]